MAVIFGLAGVTGAAQPPWWTGDNASLVEAARQNSRYIILYFESAGSEDCLRLEAETWPNLPDALVERFFWRRFNYSAEPDPFKKFSVNDAPAILILDPDLREWERISDFVEPSALAGILESRPPVSELESEATSGTMATFGDGRFYQVEPGSTPTDEYVRERAYLIREDFESAPNLQFLDASMFEPVVDPAGTIRLDSSEGEGGGTGLRISARDFDRASPNLNPAVALRVCLSRKFHEPGVELVTGRIQVRFRIRVIRLPDDDRSKEVAALTILPAGSPPPSVEDVIRGWHRRDSIFVGRKNSQADWEELILHPNRNVQFAKTDVWLTFWVDGVFMEYVVDDLCVRVLPNESEWADPPGDKRLTDVFNPNAKPTDRFLKRDLNGDGRITKDEFPRENRVKLEQFERRKFDDLYSGWDRDKSGYLDPSEFR